MTFLRALIALVTKIAGLVAASEAVIRLVRFIWFVFLRLTKRRASFGMSFAGARI
jgi:hypothetical protein